MIGYRTVGAKEGRCNICGVYGPLTEDHVPPKGCVPPKPAMIGHITSRQRARSREIKGTKVNHGVVYRTLCASCNNVVLGQEYDPELISMSAQVATLIDIPLYIPSTSTVRVRPQRIARAVLGHLLAIGIDRFAAGEMGEASQKYVLGPAQHIPSDLKFYYWVYPGMDRVLVRDAGIMTLRTKGTSHFWLMKFYPLAFMAVWRGDLSVPGLRTFDLYSSYGIDDEIDLPVDLNPVPNEYFPELPQDYEMILYGEDAIITVDRPAVGRVIRI
jgi:hypothetical protein